MSQTQQTSVKPNLEMQSPTRQASIRSAARRLMFVGLEFLVLVLLIALVPAVVYLDVTVFSDAMTEESLTEFLHNALLVVSIIFMTAGAFKFAWARGYLLLVITFFSCLFIREQDAVFDQIWKGFWVVPALGALTLGTISVYRNRETLLEPLLRHLETRPGTFVYIGVLLLIIFTRLFGTGSLWEAVMGVNYVRVYKSIIQEGLELMSYTLIAYGSVMSYVSGLGRNYLKQEIDKPEAG